MRKRKILTKSSKSNIAIASYSLIERCTGCQSLKILLAGQVTTIMFSQGDYTEMVEMSKTLRGFLIDFEKDFKKMRIADLKERIKSQEGRKYTKEDLQRDPGMKKRVLRYVGGLTRDLKKIN